MLVFLVFFFFKQKTAYELRISDWSSDVCSSDLIDCTFPVGGDASTLRDAIARVRREAEDAVRAGRSELFLSDNTIGEDRVGMAMVLAAAAVHTHLVRKGLRSYASINVRPAEVLDNPRSDERRVGTQGVRRCSSRGKQT